MECAFDPIVQYVNQMRSDAATLERNVHHCSRDEPHASRHGNLQNIRVGAGNQAISFDNPASFRRCP